MRLHVIYHYDLIMKPLLAAAWSYDRWGVRFYKIELYKFPSMCMFYGILSLQKKSCMLCVSLTFL